MSLKEIDEIAYHGYNYAIGSDFIPEFTCDMDLMAFNSGISNANVRNNLNINPLISNTKKIIQGRGREPHKVIGLIMGQM